MESTHHVDLSFPVSRIGYYIPFLRAHTQKMKDIRQFKTDIDVIMEKVKCFTMDDLDQMRREATRTHRIDAQAGSYEELVILFLRTCTMSDTDYAKGKSDESTIPFLLKLLQKISNIEGMRVSSGKTLLHVAATENPKIIFSLASMGCVVDRREVVFSNTPMHTSCIYGQIQSMFNLIQCGAGINLRNGSKETPLDIYLHLSRNKMEPWMKTSRIAIAHTFARMGFRLTPRHKCHRRETFKNTIFHSFHKQKTCNSVLSLKHICRLTIRERLPPQNLQPSVKTLPVPALVREYLLYRPIVLDNDVICPHMASELIPYLSLNANDPALWQEKEEKD